MKKAVVKTLPEGGIRLSVTVEISAAEMRGWDAPRLAMFFAGLSRVVAARSAEEVLGGLEAERRRTDQLIAQLQAVQQGLEQWQRAGAAGGTDSSGERGS
jgi:hypothetical protein